MRVFFILFHKELRGFFLSPLAYVVIALVTLLNSVSFRLSLESMLGDVSQQSLLFLTFNSFWFWMVFFLVFPLITMRLFAEEKKLGTLETLLTAPIRTSSLLLAKYFATVVFYCILWIPSALNFVVFEMISDTSAAFTGGAFLGTYLALFLIGLFNISLGCFASALTSNQVIAAVVAFTLVMLHFFLGFLHIFSARMPAYIMERITYFSTFEHLKTFSQGLLDTRPVVYYLSFTVLMLTFTYYVLQYRRWKP